MVSMTDTRVTATEADREFAIEIYRRFRYGADEVAKEAIRAGIKRGEHDGDPIVQLAASHRLAHQPASADQEAVAWWSDAGSVAEARRVFQDGRKALLKERDINTHLKGVYEPIIAALEPMLSTLADLDTRSTTALASSEREADHLAGVEAGIGIDAVIAEAKRALRLVQGCLECNADDERRWSETIAWLEGLA